VLLGALGRAGIEVVPPGGAFYLFPRSPFPDEMEFVATAREEGILVVPGSGFGRAGHFRLAYCVSPEMVKRSVPAWERLGARIHGRKGCG
jgi:aspartate aminotransferase